MKALKFLKMNMALAGLAIVMTGCLNSEDPDFEIGVNQAYVMQYGTGEHAMFAPYISIYSPAHAIKSATLGYNGAVYNFSRIGDYTSAMQISAGSYTGIPLSTTIPNGTYNIEAVSQPDNLLATNSFTLNIDKDLKLGPVHVKSFTYTAAEGIRAQWEKTENATDYYISIIPVAESGSLGRILYLWQEDNHGEENTGTFNPNSLFQAGQKLRVAVAAIGGKSAQMPNIVVMESESFDIVWGTDYDPENPPVEE